MKRGLDCLVSRICDISCNLECKQVKFGDTTVRGMLTVAADMLKMKPAGRLSDGGNRNLATAGKSLNN